MENFIQKFASLSDEKQGAIIRIVEELEKAESKHPKWPTNKDSTLFIDTKREKFIVAAAIVSEEARELIRAANQFALENNGDTQQFFDMTKEAAHTAATAIRFILNA